VEKRLAGGGKEYLFGRIDGSHDARYGLPAPLRTVADEGSGVLIIRPIGPSRGSLAPSMLSMSNTVRDTGVQPIMADNHPAMTLTSFSRHG
jgi:hypothetical protein